MISHFNHIRLFVTLWTVAPQAPQSMRFSKQEYWSGLPLPSPNIMSVSIKISITNLIQIIKELWKYDLKFYLEE